MNTFSDLLSNLEGMGGQQAVQVLEGLLTQTGSSGTQAIRIGLAQDEDGTVGISVGGRSFSISPESRPSDESPPDVAIDCVPKPTLSRWQEEFAIVPGASSEQVTNLAKHVINRLLPEARRSAEENAKIALDNRARIQAKHIHETIEPTMSAALGEPQAVPMQSPVATDEDVQMGTRYSCDVQPR